jgi:hypothetical protein
MLGTIALATSLIAVAVPMRTIDKGTQSLVDDGRNVTVRTADEWTGLWRQHKADRPAPPVDFSREMVVGVFLGSRPTSGYQVEIVGVREEGESLVVEYRVTSPGRDAMTAQVITMPYHLVAVPRLSGEVKFKRIDD